MKQIFNSCRCWREQLSLLVSGLLSDEERAALEDHLSDCANCRRYRDEIKSVTASLLRWKENLSSLEPSEAALARWEKDLVRIGKPKRAGSDRFVRWFFEWCKDLFWPSRRIWAGLAAVWVVILGVNVSRRSSVPLPVANRTLPSSELVRAFFEGDGLVDPANPPAEKNVKPNLQPAPRSDWHSGAASNESI